MRYANSVMISMLFSTLSLQVEAQDNEKKDTIPATKSSVNKTEGDRNVMLNAANNTGPRDVNIGLPATVGGIFEVGFIHTPFHAGSVLNFKF